MAEKQNKSPEEGKPQNISRRELLRNVGVVGAAVVGGSAATQAIAADESGGLANAAGSRKGEIPIREALENLTALEAETLEAICDCLIPADENGPGAREARAVHYIDRSLASHNASDRENYAIGVAAINEYAVKTRGKAYPELSKDLQNSILLAVQQNKIEGFAASAAGFFNMVRNHTIDGTFCDPYYGGNQNYVGWDLVRYPGIRLGVSEADVAKGRNLEPNHTSAYDNQIYTKAGNSNARGGSNA